MIHDHLADALDHEPFEPFRIKLENGDYYDIFDPQSVALMTAEMNIASSDGNWVIFPLGKITSLESLIADYQGHVPAAP